MDYVVIYLIWFISSWVMTIWQATGEQNVTIEDMGGMALTCAIFGWLVPAVCWFSGNRKVVFKQRQSKN